jgi:hypothetical protein
MTWDLEKLIGINHIIGDLGGQMPRSKSRGLEHFMALGISGKRLPFLICQKNGGKKHWLIPKRSGIF